MGNYECLLPFYVFLTSASVSDVAMHSSYEITDAIYRQPTSLLNDI